MIYSKKKEAIVLIKKLRDFIYKIFELNYSCLTIAVNKSMNGILIWMVYFKWFTLIVGFWVTYFKWFNSSDILQMLRMVNILWLQWFLSHIDHKIVIYFSDVFDQILLTAKQNIMLK